ncbi:hypothetical protein BH23CHL10_BH23CHL10_16650 [soil metagenome]
MLVGLVRLVHPAPTLTVVVLSAALGTVLMAQTQQPLDFRLALTVLAVLGSQILTGALNDWTDRSRDTLGQPSKPIPSGLVSPPMALAMAGAGLALQIGGSLPLGLAPMTLGLAASASAISYNLWLSHTPASVMPYLVSFGLLPLWVAAGVGVPLDRVALSPILVGPFAAAAHLANTLRDFDADATLGSRNLAQVLGRRIAFRVGWSLAMGVGLAVGFALSLGGTLEPPGVLLGVVGLAAVTQGISGPHRLWMGMLVAAVCWTAAWALATG